ncbi:MAG: YHS domain-containing protein [Candidatus Rokubacteria bacterium]|nr:YHS domain-containing protein [Candidatus Rokubacteria bacterium]MBI3108150.1 YHS domain-containing protein [Candidatus Rokubacteria bacterium]
MAWDPVCWMEVDESHATETAEVAGRRVCFCSRGCRAIFERAPATYWSPAVPAELEELYLPGWSAAAASWTPGARSGAGPGMG